MLQDFKSVSDQFTTLRSKGLNFKVWQKTQGFRQDLYGYDLVLYPRRLREHFRGITKSLRVS